MKLLMGKPFVSGTILPDRLKRFAVEGIQFRGTWLPVDQLPAQDASGKYHLKHPFALAIPGQVSAVQLREIKMAKRKPGPGKGIIWTGEEPAKK